MANVQDRYRYFTVRRRRLSRVVYATGRLTVLRARGYVYV